MTSLAFCPLTVGHTCDPADGRLRPIITAADQVGPSRPYATGLSVERTRNSEAAPPEATRKTGEERPLGRSPANLPVSGSTAGSPRGAPAAEGRPEVSVPVAALRRGPASALSRAPPLSAPRRATATATLPPQSQEPVAHQPTRGPPAVRSPAPDRESAIPGHRSTADSRHTRSDPGYSAAGRNGSDCPPAHRPPAAARRTGESGDAAFYPGQTALQ